MFFKGGKGIFKKNFKKSECGMLKKLVQDYGVKCCFWLIMLVGIGARVLFLGSIPGGLNQDEAYVAYEAFSMLEFGVDSWGFKNPCYFVSWGSGMNVFYAYLLKVFFACLGYSEWVIRLPQSIMSVVGAYVLYLFLDKGYGKKVALFGLFLIMIMPWSIMGARWGLESALLPACLMVSVMCLVKGFDDVKFLYFSFLGFGCCLYTYAVCWGFLAMFLPLAVGYFWWYNKDKWKNILLAGGGLFVMALPLIWFLLVNVWGVEQYKGEWLSVPKLVYWRGNEWGYGDLKVKLEALYYVFILQNRMVIREVIEGVGLFYKYWWVLFVLGMWGVCADIKNKGIKDAKISVILVLWFVVGLMYAMGLYASGTRVNFLFMPVMAIMAVGGKVMLKNKWLACVVVGLYLVCFAGFLRVYFGDNDRVMGEYFSVGLKEALEYADKERQVNFERVVVIDNVASYPKVLWFRKISQDEFMRSVAWKRYPDAYLEAKWISHYEFVENFDKLKIEDNKIYIIEKKYAPFFYKFDKKEFGRFIVAVPKAL